MVSFVPFFAVTVYYFSMILYRMSFLTLISLIPCAVYVKVLSDIDNVYVALIALLNVAILMSSVRQKRENGRMVVGNDDVGGGIYLCAADNLRSHTQGRKCTVL